MTNNNLPETLLEFPEKFSIKAFGLDNNGFHQTLRAIVDNHVPDEDILNWKNNASSKGKYVAITVTIMARSKLQLDAIYIDLSANEHIKMAL